VLRGVGARGSPWCTVGGVTPAFGAPSNFKVTNQEMENPIPPAPWLALQPQFPLNEPKVEQGSVPISDA
jgi:hypothetical protein